MKSVVKETYYKYRSMDVFERFLDIVVNNRLYGAVYSELNDPMEGMFNKYVLCSSDRIEIRKRLETTRICSMMIKRENQPFPNDDLMWSHYANGHRGCCIEFQSTGRYNNGWIPLPIKYGKVLPKVDGTLEEKIYKVLSAKNEIWIDENEKRFVKQFDNKDVFDRLSRYFHINIQAIYFGCNAQNDKIEIIKKILNKTNPKIKLFKIQKKETKDLYPELKIKKIG